MSQIHDHCPELCRHGSPAAAAKGEAQVPVVVAQRAQHVARGSQHAQTDKRPKEAHPRR